MASRNDMTSKDRVERRIAGQMAGLERRRRKVRLLLACAAAVMIAAAIITAAVVGSAPDPARAEAGLPPIVGVVEDESVAATPEADADSEATTDAPAGKADAP